ncbi:limbin-like isoform X2 [Siphateles boraxobius]|uniref:limbin-like isoform X2 n=1 Tax=Siphateles boraxobius TaxID=180520 RepID=UPI0040638C6D
MDGWFVIMSALLFISRVEDAARARARVRHRSTSVRSDHHQEKIKDLEKLQRKKEMRRSISSSVQYTDDVISSHALFGQWADQRTRRNMSNRSATKPSAFGVSFLKCAQVDSGVELRVTLLVRNPEEGQDLSQLCIRDSVSDVTLLQTNGSVQERGYQTFSTDTLPAGSQFVVLYKMSVKGNRKQVLTLPAFLTFSNATQNDIHLFGPVVANFTLRINTTEQVDVDRSLLLLGSFLLFLLLLSLSVVSVKLLQRRRLRISAHTRSSVNEEAGPYEGTCDITASANEEAAFEDKFVDILMLEDPQNMMESLDSLSVSTLSRAAVALELVRVLLFKGGLVSVLLAGVRAEGRVLGVVHGQIVGMEGKVQEDHVARMKALAARCNLETQEQIESLQRKHTSEAAHAERLLQHAPQQQDHQDVGALLEELHQREQKRLRNRLRLRHEHASAQTLRQQTLSRRCELHKILGEELEEAVRTGELEKASANRLLLQYYSCQDVLEEGLDVLLANQRALLAERHAQRRFLAKSLQSLQTVTSEAFSIRDTHRECSDVQREILRIKQSFEETVSRERRAIRCDIIKRRRQLLSEKVCEHWRQLQAVSGSSDVTVNQYLQKWTELLMMQNNELSELINHLDEETAARTRKVSVCVLQTAQAQLKARSQTQMVQESLQRRGQAAARELRSTQGLIRQQHQQELQDQTRSRDAFRQYCSALCASQRSLSHEQRVRLQLECVKAACRLDRCLVLHHTICELERLGDPGVTLDDPGVTPAGSETQLQRSSEVTELQCFQRRLQERLRQLRSDTYSDTHSDTHSDTLQREACVFQEQQLSVCQECVAVFVASLQWEQAEKKTRVTETHTALLKLQTLITAELHCDITHAIHTHRQALEEAELRLQQEEGLWEESAEGRGSDDDDDEEGVFTVNADAGVSVLLQEALFKRQQLQRLTDRELRRNQTLEHHREKLQLKRLQAYCEQDVAFTSALVKQALITDPDLHTLLRLLLPTVPEGELLSLTHTLGPGAGPGSGGVALVDRLRLELLSRNSSSPQHTERERERLLKKRQKLLDKLLCGGSGDVHETRRRRRRLRNIPVPELEEAEPEAGHRTRDNEGAWPVDVAKHSLVSMRNEEEEWPVDVAKHSLVSMRNEEEEWPVGVAKHSLVSMRNEEEEWPVGVAQDSTVRDGNEGAWPVGVAQDSVVMDYNEGAWPVGVAYHSLVSSERLFVFRCVPPSAQLQTPNTRSRKKKRNFLNFKKASVAPQQHT